MEILELAERHQGLVGKYFLDSIESKRASSFRKIPKLTTKMSKAVNVREGLSLEVSMSNMKRYTWSKKLQVASTACFPVTIKGQQLLLQMNATAMCAAISTAFPVCCHDAWCYCVAFRQSHGYTFLLPLLPDIHCLLFVAVVGRSCYHHCHWSLLYEFCSSCTQFTVHYQYLVPGYQTGTR